MGTSQYSSHCIYFHRSRSNGGAYPIREGNGQFHIVDKCLRIGKDRGNSLGTIQGCFDRDPSHNEQTKFPEACVFYFDKKLLKNQGIQNPFAFRQNRK